MGEILVQVIAVAHADGPLQREEFLGETAENFQRGILVGQEDVAPHGWIAGGDPREIPKPCGRILDHFTIRYPAQVIGHAHHRIGDKMRGMGGHCKHEIVVIGIHPLGIGAERLPEPFETLDRGLVRVGLGHDQVPAVVEEFGKAGGRSRLLGAGERVGGDEMHAFGDMRGHGIDHGALDRADIAHCGAGGEHGADFGGHGGHCAHGDAEHHQIGAFTGFGGAVADAVAKADVAGRLAGGLRAGIARHFARHARAFHRPEHRRGDEPEADQRHPVVDRGCRLGHSASPMNWPMAWATRRQLGSSPTVMRRQWGSL